MEKVAVCDNITYAMLKFKCKQGRLTKLRNEIVINMKIPKA